MAPTSTQVPHRTAAELRADLRLYGLFCKKFTLRAQAHGRAVATNLFVAMLNPKMRGPAFRWDRLAEMATRSAEVSAYQGFSDREWKTYGPLIQECAANSARIAARELLKDSDVETWLPLCSTSEVL